MAPKCAIEPWDGSLNGLDYAKVSLSRTVVAHESPIVSLYGPSKAGSVLEVAHNEAMNETS